MTEIRGAYALVTGAASGLGRLMALGIARRGGGLFLWDRNGEGLKRVVEEIETIGGEAHPFVCDVSDRDAVYATAREVEAVAPVDILINNAGVVSGQRFLDLPDEQIETSFRVNALALFWTSKAFLPGMIARGTGHLVTIASAAGLIGVARLSDYCATKWAAVGFDESLRVELRKSAPRLRTTVVCPYYVRTGMFEGVRTRFSFLLPLLEEEKVAERVLRAIETNRRRLFMPPMVYSIPLLRVLPVSWFDAIARFMGVQSSMDGFVGRGRARSSGEH